MSEIESNPFPGIRLMVFDLDGTLVDAFDDIAASANHALVAQGRPSQDVKTIFSYVGHGGRQLMRDLLALTADGAPIASQDVPDEQVVRAFDDWADYYRQHPADHAKPYPGVVATLTELRKRGVRLAVFSNKLHELICEILHRLDLTAFFDEIQGEEPGEPRKPDPTLLLRLMERQGVAPEETLMIGDGEADIQVARNAGVRAIGIAYGVSDAETLLRLGAEVVFQKFTQLLDPAR